MKKKLIDLVIPTSGRFDMLGKCVDAIYSHATVPLGVTVVDDGCDKEEKLHYSNLFKYDKSKDLHENIVSYTTKRHEKTEVFPKTCNDGARQASAGILVFLNDDVEIHEGFFDNIIRVMEDKNVGICGARLLFPENSTHPRRPAGKVQHVGIALDIHANPIHPLVGWSADNPKTKFIREVLAVTGGALSVRKDLFRSVGGFDPIYGMGTYEDVDLCLKVRQKGYRIIMDTSIEASHYVGATVEKKKISYPLQINSMIFKTRWGNSGYLPPDNWTYG